MTGTYPEPGPLRRREARWPPVPPWRPGLPWRLS